MLKKILLLLCLCFIPVTSALASSEIIGHVYYWKDAKESGYAIFEKGEYDYIENDLRKGKRMKFYATDDVEPYLFDSTSTCNCNGCSYMKEHGTDFVNYAYWKDSEQEIIGMVQKLINELKGRDEYKEYFTITEYGHVEDYCNNASKVFVWKIIGHKEPEYTVTIRNIVGEGNVKIDGSAVQRKLVKEGESCEILFEPADGWKLSNVTHNGKEGAHNIDWGNTYPIGPIYANQHIDVEFIKATPEPHKVTIEYINPGESIAYISESRDSITNRSLTKEEHNIADGSWRYIHIKPVDGYVVKQVDDSGIEKAHLDFEAPYGIQVNGDHYITIYFEKNTMGSTGTPPVDPVDPVDPVEGKNNIKIIYATEGGTACISSTLEGMCPSPHKEAESVDDGALRYIHFQPHTGYKLSRVDKEYMGVKEENIHKYLTAPYHTGAIMDDLTIIVYFEKTTSVTPVVTLESNPYKHEITTLNIVNPAGVKDPEPKRYEPGKDLGLKTDYAYTQQISLSPKSSILTGKTIFNDLHKSNSGKPQENVLLGGAVLSKTGDYDKNVNGIGINEIDVKALYPYSIHKALQTIYISPNWYIGKKYPTGGGGSDPDPTPEDSKPSIPGNDDDSALKIVSVRDLRWQNIVNNYKPKWGLSTANKNKPLLNPYNVTLGGSTVDISKLKTGYAVEFTFDITEAFCKYGDHNIQIDVDFAKNGKMIAEKDESKLLQYRESYGAAPKTLDSYYRAFNLNNDAHKSKFLVTETKRNSDGGATYKFVYYVPSTLFVNDGTALKADDRLDIYFNISARRGSTEYFSYNKLAKDLYGWNGWVFSYDLTKSNLQDIGSNAN